MLVIKIMRLFKRVQRDETEGTWCTVEYNQRVFRAQIVHIGGGRYRILKDNKDGAYIGHVVDASDIFSCER
jgi:hypothetical protein